MPGILRTWLDRKLNSWIKSRSRKISAICFLSLYILIFGLFPHLSKQILTFFGVNGIYGSVFSELFKSLKWIRKREYDFFIYSSSRKSYQYSDVSSSNFTGTQSLKKIFFMVIVVCSRRWMWSVKRYIPIDINHNRGWIISMNVRITFIVY